MDAEEFARNLAAALRAESFLMSERAVTAWQVRDADGADELQARSDVLRDVAQCIETAVGAQNLYGAANPVAGSTSG